MGNSFLEASKGGQVLSQRGARFNHRASLGNRLLEHEESCPPRPLLTICGISSFRDVFPAQSNNSGDFRSLAIR